MALNPSTDLTLSTDFTDILSSDMLVAPDAQFVFAQWAYSAAIQQQAIQLDGYDLAALQLQNFRITDSGDPSNIDAAMSKGMGGPLLLAMGMKYPDMFQMVKEAVGPGTTIKINRPRFVDGLTTPSLRQLSATSKLFGNSQPVTMDQVDITIQEVAGPGDSAGIVSPFEISLFTQNRAKHDLLKYLGNELRRDRYKYVDDKIITMLLAAANGAGNVTRGADTASNAAFVGGGNEPMSFDLIPKMVEQFKTRFVPGLQSDGRYVAVLHQRQIQQLKNDPAYQRLSVFQPTYNPLFPGYVATVENIVLCESNRMPTLTNLGAGANQTGYQGLVMAPSVMGWACARDAWAVRNNADDGGRSGQFGWLAFEGWQVLDDRFVQLVITT